MMRSLWCGNYRERKPKSRLVYWTRNARRRLFRKYWLGVTRRKRPRGELSYTRKRDFLDMLGVVVTISYPETVNAGSTYDMRVRLPALQALIRLPQPEPCDAYSVE